MYVILVSGDRYEKVFPDVPMMGFKYNKIWKDHFLRSQLPEIDETGRSKQCGGIRPCNLCKSMKDICTFQSKCSDEVSKINRDYCFNSVMAVYAIEIHVCGEQYAGSKKTMFCSRENNYKMYIPNVY